MHGHKTRNGHVEAMKINLQILKGFMKKLLGDCMLQPAGAAASHTGNQHNNKA